MVDISIVNGLINQLITGGHHLVVTPVRESGAGAANHFNLHSLGGRVRLQCECNFCLNVGSSILVVLTSPCYGQNLRLSVMAV